MADNHNVRLGIRDLQFIQKCIESLNASDRFECESDIFVDAPRIPLIAHVDALIGWLVDEGDCVWTFQPATNEEINGYEAQR